MKLFLFLSLLLVACSSTTGTDGGIDAGSCPLTPIHCAPACGGTVEPTPMCSGGSWVCPMATCADGSLPDASDGGSDGGSSDGGSSDGGCAALPIDCLPDCSGVEPPAMCIAGTLVCPTPAVCDGGASDAGTTFTCGSTPCTRNTQYCDLSDVPDCLPIPSSCPNPPTCACLSGMGHTSCSDDGAGGITTHSPGG